MYKIKKYHINRLLGLFLSTYLPIYLSTCLYGGAFDKISVGARPIGMGGAFTAVCDDGNAVYWNPAGIGKINTTQINATHQDLFGLGLVNYDFIGYLRPKIGMGTVGFGWIRFGTTSNVEFIDYSENTYIFSYGVPLPADVFVGANIKYYFVNYEEKATGYGVDIGAFREYMDKMLTIALVCQDVNRPVIRWGTTAEDELPMNLRFGVAYKPVNPLTVAVDIDKINHTEQRDDPEIHIGSELWCYKNLFGIRMGYELQEANEWNFSTGVGIQYNKMRIDYAYKRHFDLTDTHIFSLYVDFDKILTGEGAAKKLKFADTIGPKLTLMPDMISFSPDGDGMDDVISFIITAADESGIGIWKLEITDVRGNRVYAISAEDIPPPVLEWSGIDISTGKPLPEGKYVVIFSAKDKKGNSAELEPMPITIKFE
ncbi:MAG: PorV/PorQ family protein [Elusimicrobia bacterium]|nr:PorV/PorQ family protein [Elusimicrobiota bacterium]